MRFIDMFMAAVGALVFMSMLLAFLLKYLPPPDDRNKNGEQDQKKEEPLQILTKDLPPARVGEPYEVAIAYRGGKGRITWDVVAGAQEIPTGMHLDLGQGVLAGTPRDAGVGRFIIRVRDGLESMEERAYELVIVPAPKDSGKIGRWIAIFTMAITLLIWLITIALVLQLKQRVRELENCWERGQTYVRWETGGGVKEEVELPGGIDTYKGRLQGTRRFNRFWLFLALIEAVFFIWRFWLV